jgi:flagellar hook-basal body complex protein FliE
MSDINNITGLSTADLLGKSNANSKTVGEGFAETLKKSLNNVNEMQEAGEKAMSDLATGQVKDLHQAALAIDKAEISMKFMLEVRNKALNAYKEISRTQM